MDDKDEPIGEETLSDDDLDQVAGGGVKGSGGGGDG